MQIPQCLSAVVTLVGHDLFDAPQVDLRRFRRRRGRLMSDQLRDRFARLCQSLVNGSGVALIGPLQRQRQHGAAGQVHSMFSLVSHVGAAILHLGDPGVGIIRVFPFLIGTLLLPLAV